MRKSITMFFAAAACLAFAVAAYAGGFFVLLGSPEASPEARAHNAYVTVKMAGCHEPEKAAITGQAIGIVAGRRQTIDLKLTPLAEPGMYAVPRQWPSEGRWVLQFAAHDHDRVTSAVVLAGPQGIDRATAKYAMNAPSPTDVAALLDNASGARIARK
jgi:hypothetical protein